MEIIPAIYIFEGRAISYYKGHDNDEKSIYRDSPAKIAKNFARKGLNKIHLVDLEGSFQNRIINIETIEKIAREVSADIQATGGIRTIAEIDQLFAVGVKRVILGYSAKGIIKEALAKYGHDRIYGGLKAKRNVIDTDFPLEKPLEVLHAGEEFKALGIENLVYKDLEAEGTFFPRFDEFDGLISFLKINVYLSGGISEISHLKILKNIGAKGAIIGRAFLEGKISVSEALGIANE